MVLYDLKSDAPGHTAGGIFTWQADGKFSIMLHVLFAVIEWMTQEVYTYGDQITSDQRYDKRGTGE